MLIGPRQFLHRMHMQPTFVRKRRHPHVRRTDVMRHVRQLIHKEGQIPQPGQIHSQLDPHLQLQVRNHRHQIAVPNPLPIPIDRPLHLTRPSTHRRQRIRDAHPTIVMRVNPHWLAQMRDHLLRHLFHKLRQRSPIRLTQHHQICPRIRRRLHRLQRILRILPKAVKEVFRIIQHFTSVTFQIRHRIRNHRQILLQRHLKHLGHMQCPRLPHHRHHRRLRIQ